MSDVIKDLLEMPQSPERAAKTREILKIIVEDPSELADELVAALDSENWQQRKLTAELLLLSKDASLIAVQRALRSENDNKRYWGMWILRELGTRKAFETTVRLLNSKQRALRSLALDAMAGYIKVKSALPYLIECLDDPEWTLRSRAAELICEIGRPALSLLKEAYQKASPDGKYWTIRVIGMIMKAENEDITPLLKIMLAGDKQTRMHVMTALSGLQDPRFIKVLVNLFSDQEWIVRSQAAETLSELGDPAAKACASAVLKAGDGDIAFWGIKVVAAIRQEKAVPWFRKLISQNPMSEDLRYFILDAIPLCHNAPTAEFLIDMLSDPFWNARRKTHIILRGFPERFLPVIVDALQKAASDGNEDLIYWLVSTLFHMGRSGLYPIIKLFEGASDSIRRLIMSLAVDVNPTEHIFLDLCLKALDDPLWTIRSQAAKIIINFGKAAVNPLVVEFHKNPSGDRGYWTEYILKSAGKDNEKLLEKLCREAGVNSLADIGGHLDEDLLSEEDSVIADEEQVEEASAEYEEASIDDTFFDSTSINDNERSILHALKAEEPQRQLLGLKMLIEMSDFSERSVAFLLESIFPLTLSDNDELSVRAFRTMLHIVENAKGKMVGTALAANASIQRNIADIISMLEGTPFNNESISLETRLGAIICLADDMTASRIATIIEDNSDSEHIPSLLTALAMLSSPDSGRVALKYALESEELSLRISALFALEKRGIITHIPDLLPLVDHSSDRIKSAFTRYLCSFDEKSVVKALTEAAGQSKSLKLNVLSLFSRIHFTGVEPILLDWIALAEDEEILLACMDALKPCLTDKACDILNNIITKLGDDSPSGVKAIELLQMISSNKTSFVRSFTSYKTSDYYLGWPDPENESEANVEEQEDFSINLQAMLDKRDELKKKDEMKVVLDEMQTRIGEMVAPRLKKGELNNERCAELFIQLTKYDYFIKEKASKTDTPSSSLLGKLKGALDSAGIATSHEDPAIVKLKTHRSEILKKMGEEILEMDPKIFEEDYDLSSLISQAKSMRSRLNDS